MDIARFTMYNPFAIDTTIQGYCARISYGYLVLIILDPLAVLRCVMRCSCFAVVKKMRLGAEMHGAL